MKYEITLSGTSQQFFCNSGETVLAAMLRLGISEIPVGCRSGGCGVCKVRVISGQYECKKMSRAQVAVDEEQQGYVLACRCQPLGNLSIELASE